MNFDCWTLAASRLLGLCLASPFLGGVPWRIRWAVPVVFALGMPGVATSGATRWDLSQPWIAAMTLGGELALGFVLGWSSILVLGAIRGVALLIVDQSSLALGSANDSGASDGPPALADFYSILVLALIVTLDLHHAVLRAAAWSFNTVPPGEMSFARVPAAMEKLLAQAGPHLFEAAMCIGFPVLSVLLITGLGQAVLARVLPEVDYFAFGPALRSAVGLGVACVSLPFFADASRSLFGNAILQGSQVLSGMGR